MKKKEILILKHRQILTLSQEEFAEYLGINRGLLSMAEIGKRTLPTSAHLKWMEIAQVITQIEQVVLPEEWQQAERENTQRLLQEKLSELQFQILKVERDLEVLAEAYDLALAQCRCIFYFAQNPSIIPFKKSLHNRFDNENKWRKKLIKLKTQYLKKEIELESLRNQRAYLEAKIL